MKIITDKNIRCVKPSGRIDANSCNDLDLAIAALYENGGDIIIDLSECHYLSSAGIRILLKTRKRLLASQDELFITGVFSEVFHVLEMAGLHTGLQLEPTVEAALAVIRMRKHKKIDLREISFAENQWVYKPSGENILPGQFRVEPEIVSYHELGYALGFGSLSGKGTDGDRGTDFFAALINCSAFLPHGKNKEPDFRIISDPAKTGLPVHETLSFGSIPFGLLKLNTPEKVTSRQLFEAISHLRENDLPKDSVILVALTNQEKEEPSLSLLLMNNSFLAGIIKENRMDRFRFLLGESENKKDFIGVTFRLSRFDTSAGEQSLGEIIRHQLDFENVVAVEPFNTEKSLENPVAWLFPACQFVDGRTKRLDIRVKEGFVLEPHQAFLARLLYSDSSRLQIDPLHGGYTAQTFFVTSFDHEGRKMRPTVLKIGHRKLVSRESERCRQYALPYIFNNSAMVLGTEYYGETGALRYNFVGIGGESSQLKWLTHYYHKEDFAFLEPLFDKVFLQILNPWYGQPVKKTIFPFRDHDPTFTFFPHICQMALELFSISADEKFLKVQEADRPILNPYWFLKHEYARRRDWSMEYPTGICHGDLNMQNILLDESMNVYLIDFSETRPRSVISDFARLEAIFMVDNASVENETDMADYLDFISDFYKTEYLDDIPLIRYTGKHTEKVRKNSALTLKMRKYAFDSAGGNRDPVPYYIALLEWVLPIVCYSSLPVLQKRLSMILSSILCEKLMRTG